MWLALLPWAFAAPDIHPHRVLVKSPAPLQVGEVVSPGVTVERPLRVPGWYALTVDGDPEDQAIFLARDPRFSVAETDPVISLDTPLDELDPDFPSQWGLENLPSRGGHWDADIDVLDAWDQGATGANTVVAVLDSGLDLDHPALVSQLWTNPDEIPDNGVDDDGNGLVDDVHGADFVNRDGDPADTHGHGTACAGVIAAAADGQSTVGVAPDARIMGVQILYGGGTDEAFASVAADAMVYAADEGADVLSNSWRYGRKEREVVTDAIQYAVDQGSAVVFSAGNTPLDADQGGFFPSNSPVDALISVAATTRHDELVYFDGLWASSFGATTIELAAPGDAVLAPELGGGYLDFSGTSASAPMVAATAALLRSVDPTLSPADLREILVESADPLGLPVISQGRLNAGGAVRLARTGVPPTDLAVNVTPAAVGAPTLFTAYGGEDAEYTWYFPDVDAFASGRQVSHTFQAPGPWTVVVESIDPDGRRGRVQHTVDLPITDWTEIEDQTVESLHDLFPNHGVWVVETGEEAAWTRLHFERIEFQSSNWNHSDAFLMVMDEEGLWVWSFEGAAEDLWTPPLPGHTFSLVWQLEGDAEPSWGVHMDRVQAWIPAEPVEDDPGSSPPEATGLRGGRGCAHVSAPWTAALWLLIVFRRRGACS